MHSPSNRYNDFDLRFTAAQVAHDPVALWTSQESRAVALKHYQLRDLKSLRQYRTKDTMKYHHAAYIDYSIDQFVFPTLHYFYLDPGEKATDIIEGQGDWPRFLAKSEHAHIRDVHIFSGDYEAAKPHLEMFLRGWLSVLTGLRKFMFTVTLGSTFLGAMHGVGVVSRGEYIWVPRERDVNYRQVILDELERYRMERLAEGVVWEAPFCDFEFVRLENDEVLNRAFYQF